MAILWNRPVDDLGKLLLGKRVGAVAGMSELAPTNGGIKPNKFSPDCSRRFSKLFGRNLDTATGGGKGRRAWLQTIAQAKGVTASVQSTATSRPYLLWRRREPASQPLMTNKGTANEGGLNDFSLIYRVVGNGSLIVFCNMVTRSIWNEFSSMSGSSDLLRRGGIDERVEEFEIAAASEGKENGGNVLRSIHGR
ncbi:hypothetical protein K438DRAFT_1763263 [Mycena galopus ATCC 62051]|nr:hypothetical protein K438DRAFT_1763263 [Mycena galopus ATCC 62051]